MKPKHLIISLAILLIAVWMSACGQASSQNAHTGHEQHEIDTAPISTLPEQAVQPSRTIKVSTNDQMRFAPESLTVRVGEIIRFEVTNTGVLPHEFIIGTAHFQAEHAQAMESGDPHSDTHHGDTSDYALSIPPGETATLIYTFDQPGDLFYGCHVPGHYAAGMKGAITVTAAN